MSANIFLARETLEPTESGPLDGLDVAVKDNISTAGVPTTCGSRMLEGYVPPYDATVVERVREAGGRIVGKTNMDEFGMGTTTETSAFGPTENPAAEGRVPGGSSGGSAAAVAAGEADLALGSDTGGSVRCPAAFTGVVGLKPTYGLVSRYGLVAYANSLEQIGPMAPDVEGVARLLEVIAGPDERDATTADAPASGGYLDAVDAGVDGLTVAVPEEMREGVADPVLEAVDAGLERLEAAGAAVVDVSLPALDAAVQAYYVIAMGEASSNLARFDGVRYGHAEDAGGDWNETFAARRAAGFGEEVTRRVLLGTFALSAGYQERYYRQAQHARAWLARDFDELFASVDAIVGPTMPVEPFPLGEALEDPVTMYRADANTVPVNLANLPAISVPVEPTRDLPVGAQVIAPAFEEATVLRVGAVLAA
ncbi:MAG: Asp-tRNA(Asn)/Glu-tRNA(Gln) amidotransferase subunit GatA [Halobacteriales archaeon]